MSKLNTTDCSTVVDLLLLRVQQTPDADAFCVTTDGGQWQSVSWRRHLEKVETLAKAFFRRGILPGDRIAILAPTCIEWEWVQMAALRIGASVVGIDVNYTDEQLLQVLAHLNLSGLVATDEIALGRVAVEIRDRLKFKVCIEQAPDLLGGVPTLDQFSRAEDEATIPVNVANLPTAPKADDEAIIVFSSGTTGSPKPISYRHGQVMEAITALAACYPDVPEHCRFICWLPLANAFQRVTNFMAMTNGATTYMVRNPLQVASVMPVANPYLFIGVPRYFERVHAAICEHIAKRPRLIARAIEWAIRLGQARCETAREGRHAGLATTLLWPFVDRFILQNIRKAFGTELRYFISGSAPMPHKLLIWFEALGAPILEAYGISENIVPMALNRVSSYKLGAVGRPLSKNDIRLAEDGEIMVRGPGVFSGYLGSTLPVSCHPHFEGFHPTGDLGKLDEQGYLFLVGRKTDIFKTSTGRWIVPTDIEQRLKALPKVDDALVFGINRKVPIVLLFVTGGAEPPFAATGGDPKGAALTRAFELTLADLPSYQHPAGVLIIDQKPSVQGGELTTNLKLKRRFIESKYMEHIERIYARIEEARIVRGDLTAGQVCLIVERA